MGPRGLNVLAITHEPREQVLKYLAQGNPAPMTYTIGAEGGLTMKNPTGKIPYSWLIGPEGTVVWQAGGAPPDKLIQEELKKIKITPEQKAAKAEKALAYAESLLGGKQFVRGMAVLTRITKESKGTEAAKKAEERLAALEKDEAAKPEIAAQKELDRLVTGLEMPREKLKGKERDGKAAQLEGFIKKHKEAAPAAAEMASLWIRVMQQKWEDGAK